MVLLESQIKMTAGDSAPAFELMGIDDRMHSLDGYREYDALLVIFMCNHCPYVKAKIDAMKELHDIFKERVAIVGINSNDASKYPDDSFDSMKIMAAEKDIKFDYLVDSTQEVARAYGAICTPDPFLFDRDRKLVFHGRIDNAMTPEETATEKTMASNISRLLNGERIEKEFDPSIGCSIKWK